MSERKEENSLNNSQNSLPFVGSNNIPINLLASRQASFASTYCFDEIGILADLVRWSKQARLPLKQAKDLFDYSAKPLLSRNNGGNCLSLSSAFALDIKSIGLKCRIIPSRLDERAASIRPSASHNIKTVGLLLDSDPPMFLGVSLCNPSPIPVIEGASASFWGKTYSISRVGKNGFTLVTIDNGDHRERTYSFDICPPELEIQRETIAYKHIYTVLKYEAPDRVFSIGLDLAESTCYFRLGGQRVKRVSAEAFLGILEKYRAMISKQFSSATIVDNIILVLKARCTIVKELLDQTYFMAIMAQKND